MKKILIVCVICLITVVSVFFITRNREKDTQVTYDVYQMLQYNASIQNMSYETESPAVNGDVIVYFYKKDNLIKFMNSTSQSIFGIVDSELDKVTMVNLKKREATRITLSSNLNPYFTIIKDVLSEKDELDYTIGAGIVNDLNCIKVIFSDKQTSEVKYVIWFDLITKTIPKVQHGESEENYNLYKNIKLNSVTDADFEIPSDIKIIDN